MRCLPAPVSLLAITTRVKQTRRLALHGTAYNLSDKLLPRNRYLELAYHPRDTIVSEQYHDQSVFNLIHSQYTFMTMLTAMPLNRIFLGSPTLRLMSVIFACCSYLRASETDFAVHRLHRSLCFGVDDVDDCHSLSAYTQLLAAISRSHRSQETYKLASNSLHPPRIRQRQAVWPVLCNSSRSHCHRRGFECYLRLRLTPSPSSTSGWQRGLPGLALEKSVSHSTRV